MNYRVKLKWLPSRSNAGEVIDKSHWGDGEETLYTCARTPLVSDFQGFPNWKRTREEDILLTRNGTPYIHIPKKNSIYSNVVQRISLPGKNRRYIRYALEAEVAEFRGYGVSIESLNYEMWGNLKITLHEPRQQKRIAEFLDRETARIDQLIEKKQRLMEIQKYRLQSKLQQMVLGGASVQRGLGGDWLQNLPKDWRLTPLKHLVSVMGGATPSKEREDFWIGNIPWVSPKDMKSDVIYDVPDHVSEAALAGSAIRMVPERAVLIVVRGMILARTVPVCRLGTPATINQDMKALLPRKKIIRGDYLQRMLQGFGDILMSFVEEAAHGTKKLRSDALFGLKFPIPPMEVQQQITDEYERARVWAEKVNDVTLSSIERLREYRAALITNAVTGQVDVGAWGKQGQTDRRLDQIEEDMALREARA